MKTVRIIAAIMIARREPDGYSFVVVSTDSEGSAGSTGTTVFSSLVEVASSLIVSAAMIPVSGFNASTIQLSHRARL